MTKNNITALIVWILFVLSLGIISKFSLIYYGKEKAVFIVLVIWGVLSALLLIFLFLFLLNLFLGKKTNWKLHQFTTRVLSWLEILTFRK